MPKSHLTIAADNPNYVGKLAEKHRGQVALVADSGPPLRVNVVLKLHPRKAIKRLTYTSNSEEIWCRQTLDKLPRALQKQVSYGSSRNPPVVTDGLCDMGFYEGTYTFSMLIRGGSFGPMPNQAALNALIAEKTAAYEELKAERVDSRKNGSI
jgi:hypothetical protein